jgi:hypothetical protein
MLERQLLSVQELDTKINYHLMHTTGGLPYYIPQYTLDNRENHKNGEWFDESLFLPIEEDDFNADNENYHFGYKITISAAGHTSLSLTGDTRISGITRISPSYICSRVRYFVKNNEIVIDKVYDGLFPIRTFELTAPSNRITEDLQEFIDATINHLCNYYCDKTV